MFNRGKVNLNYMKSAGFKSQYRNVMPVKNNGVLYYQAAVMVNGHQYRQLFKTEREAALSVDRTLISNGREPINILKRLAPKE